MKTTKQNIMEIVKKAMTHCQNVAFYITNEGDLNYYNYAGNQCHANNVILSDHISNIDVYHTTEELYNIMLKR